MNRYSFRIHSRSDAGPADSRPMDPRDLSAALVRFRDTLPADLQTLQSHAEFPEAWSRSAGALRVIVHTPLDWQKTYQAMAGFAQRQGLCATHVAIALRQAARSLSRNSGREFSLILSAR